MKESNKTEYKIIGGYKRQGWALNILSKISNQNLEEEEDHKILAKAILEAADKTFYPVFLFLMPMGNIAGLYFISESDEEYQLIPFEMGRDSIKKTDKELLPFRYRTLERPEGDQLQKNWPDFS